jgi:Uncharacterised protein conserved in bacteria (DUF2336)
MEIPALSGLDSLAEIGLRGGVDMRPTLIRVLTDLYMQKLRHTAEEERHYTELALRLLDSVDASTRTAVATRLARHLSPPPRVIQYLVKDLPDVAAPLRNHPALLQPPAAPAVEQPPAPAAALEPELAPPPVETIAPVEAEPVEEPVEQVAIAESSSALDATVAGELNDLFFTATEQERRLILLNLHVAAPTSPGKVVVVRDPNVGQHLEAAALGNHRDDFTKLLAEALRIPHEQARRIARDDHGEPLVVAVKALGIPRDVVYRLLMFVNPAFGHSVERVHALAMLFDEMTAPAAEAMVAIWQALRKDARAAAKHQPLLWNDERTRARSAVAPARRPLPSPRTSVRREVS